MPARGQAWRRLPDAEILGDGQDRLLERALLSLFLRDTCHAKFYIVSPFTKIMELYFVSENETKMENKYYVISQDVSVHIFLSTAP